MNLFFHIGTERTGSSYIQSLSAINRNILQQNGIWFPSEGKNEDLLMKGEITAGNAQLLTDALNANNFVACKSIINQRIAEAKEKNCNTLFLSNELIIIALTRNNRLGQFNSMLVEMNISNINYLLFLRDPVNHALSLYKHRAKNGKAYDIMEWPKKQYLYGDALISFLKQAQLEKINLTVRKYSKRNGVLENVLFKEWLNVQDNLIPPPKVVNPSLTLSELILLKKISQNHSYLASLSYDKFIKISKKDKCENTDIVQEYKDSLSNQLVKYEDTWEICNQFLPVNEKISFPKENNSQTSISAINGSFSEKQMDAIASIIKDSLTLKGRLQIEKLKFKSIYVKMLRALKKKKKKVPPKI